MLATLVNVPVDKVWLLVTIRYWPAPCWTERPWRIAADTELMSVLMTALRAVSAESASVFITADTLATSALITADSAVSALTASAFRVADNAVSRVAASERAAMLPIVDALVIALRLTLT